jgi:osmotically-inducible protein OsmY
VDNPTMTVVKEIYDQLQKDPRTKGAVIDVGFERGMVVLTGMVKSAGVAQAAEEIARHQTGVISVTNELKVG